MPGIATVGALPGMGTQQDALGRRIFWTQDGKKLVPGGLVIDGTNSRDVGNLSVSGASNGDVLRAGTVLGKITGGFYAPSIIGALTTAYTTAGATNTVLNTTAAVAVEIVRRIGTSGNINVVAATTGNAAVASVATQNATFSAVNTTSGQITITALSAAAANGGFLCPVDGSGTPRCLVAKEDGVEVVDRFGSSYNAQLPEALVGGAVESKQITNYPTDTGLQAWLKAALRAVGYAYLFSDDF